MIRHIFPRVKHVLSTAALAPGQLIDNVCHDLASGACDTELSEAIELRRKRSDRVTLTTNGAILTTSMGRLDFLKQALPSWLIHTELPVLVVAYACTSTELWVRRLGNPRVWCLSIDVSERIHTGITYPVFNKARALNCGLRLLSTAGKSRVLLLDADTIITGPVELEAHHQVFSIVRPEAGRELTGVLSADAHILLAVGGANQAMVGYGAEDIDLRLRLYLRGHCSMAFFQDGLFVALPHDDALRTANYVEKDWRASSERNLELMVSTLSADERKRLATDPNAIVLLGAAIK